MNPTGTEHSYPNGYRETSGTTEPYAGVGQSYTGSVSTDKPAGSKPYAAPQKEEGSNLDSIANFVRTVQTKVKEIPYIVPIAIGGAGFALGVLASSRILRQLTFLSCAYAMKYALQNAPKDQIMGFAKEVLTNTFKQAQRA
jgi:hypothetical protein